MNSLVNWFNNLSRSNRIVLLVAVCMLTPIVSIVGTVAVYILGIVFNLLNWKGILFVLVVGVVFAVKALYTWVNEEDDYEVEEEPFTW